MAEMPNLEQLGEKALPQTVDNRLMAYCPSMDLIALSSTDHQVSIYRLNGQRVYGAAQKVGTLRVDSIRWKPNGQLLAIAWSDGSIRLIGAESSKVVHQFSTGKSASSVTCVGWATNLMSKRASKKSRTGSDIWEEYLVEAKERTRSGHRPSLPRDLALIDVEPSLPKLSILNGSGSSDEVFSTRSSLDALFRPFDPKDDHNVDVMVVGTQEGNVHLSIYNSFVVGSFTSPIVVEGCPAHIILHASHENSSTHSLLMKSSAPEGNIYFVPMDLRFISASSSHLSLLASRSTTLQNLLRYINQVHALMIEEWKGTQELPGRLLRNINETLAESRQRTIVQALYHSVATGHTFPAVKEWLVDELAERGHKRWDKAVVTGLENLRRLTHENMLPALERCSVILSRFSGITKFQSSNDAVGFSSHQISLIMDTIACLHLVASKILNQVIEELDLFTAFSFWLRHEIDRLASDASATANDEIVDKESLIDHGKVLLYLQTAMLNSPLAIFLGESAEGDPNANRSHVEQGLPLFDLLDKQLQMQEQGLRFMEELPRVKTLCKYLIGQTDTVFGQIAEAEKRNVLFGEANFIGVANDGAPRDMVMNPIDSSSFHTYVALIPKGSTNHVQIFRVLFVIENGMSAISSIHSYTVKLGDGRIKDIKFLNDGFVLVLWASDETVTVLGLPYRDAQGISSIESRYSIHSAKTPAVQPFVFSNDEVIRYLSKFPVSSEITFVPEIMEVRENRDGAPEEQLRRLVLLSQDRLHYKIFRISNVQPSRVSDEDVSMS